MTLKEYANDVNKSIKDLIDLGKKFDLIFEDEEHMLTEDDIILLDNNLSLIENSGDSVIEEETLVEETDGSEEVEFFEEKYFQAEESKVKKSKAKKDKISSKDRKKMYKNKEKLVANVVENEEVKLEKDEIAYKEGMSVADLSEALSVNATELIKHLMMQGIMATINNTLTFEQVESVAIEYDKMVVAIKDVTEADFEDIEFNDDEKQLETRAPIITIMGHVDHGKTTLLDTLRTTNVVDGEAGGITQHIGAYQIDHKNEKLTFLDTPGHEAFSKMRARGASVTDIVIIVVAADDGVKPQTIEAIDHAKASKVPLIIAVNKMDLPTANPDRVKQELSNHGVMCEEWGGDVIFVEISAKNGEGLDKLLDNIKLIAEMEDLKANPSRYAMGTVIEARVDKGKGVVSTILVQNGTLRLGDPIVVGASYGRVRTMHDSYGVELTHAGPSTPVEITGVSEAPYAGDRFMAFESEKKAKAISNERTVALKERNTAGSVAVTLDTLFDKIQEQQLKELPILLKADVQGSVEAVRNSIEKLEVGDVVINVVRASVGAVTESDVLLAEASGAIIIGFNVRPNATAKQKAAEDGVEIRHYNIIYKVVEELESAMKGLLDPEYEEHVLGQVEVRETIKVSKIGTVAGCYVTDGMVKSDASIRLIRDGIVIYEGELSSLKRFKDDVKEVKNGYECGMTIKNYNDIKIGDVIEAFEMRQIKVH
ncbi:MAG: translation initiation factor IF-2 [Bacilli bacterium]